MTSALIFDEEDVMLITRMIIVAAMLALTACASSPRYVAADKPGDYGYYSRKISENRYRVNFTGNRRTSLEETRDYILLRAAQLTLEHDNEWFRIVDRETSTSESHDAWEPRTGIGYERAYYVQRSCGLLACTQSVQPVTYTRMDFGADFDTGRPETRHSQSIEIVMGKGTPPEDGDYYDAEDVVKSIRAST
jgi:hypothetical protein